MGKNIGFISTRFAGTDGVSLEAAKWAQLLLDRHHVSYWFAGELDRDPGASMLVPEAFFDHEGGTRINYLSHIAYHPTIDPPLLGLKPDSYFLNPALDRPNFLFVSN
jgi:hypothetical protein